MRLFPPYAENQRALPKKLRPRRAHPCISPFCALPPALFLLIGAAALAWSFDRPGHQLVRLDQLVYSRQWAEAVRFARTHQSHPVFSGADRARFVMVIHDLNRALFHTGRLANEMFSYPQVRPVQEGDVSPLLLPSWDFSLQHREVFRKRGDLMLEMGRVNEAEQLLYDAWAYHGDQPSIFKRLAMLNLVKGRCKAAYRFTRFLERDPKYRKWAQNLRTRAKKDPSLTWNPELKTIRLANFTQDVAGRTAYDDQEYPLRLLFQSNPRNRMAYEYLMAYYLLKGDEANVAKLVPMLRNFGDTKIPRHYEEAGAALSRKDRRKRNQLGRTLHPPGNRTPVRGFQKDHAR